MDDFSSAIVIDPGNADARHYRAASRAELGHLAGAIEDCDRAIGGSSPPDFT